MHCFNNDFSSSINNSLYCIIPMSCSLKRSPAPNKSLMPAFFVNQSVHCWTAGIFNETLQRNDFCFISSKFCAHLDSFVCSSVFFILDFSYPQVTYFINYSSFLLAFTWAIWKLVDKLRVEKSFVILFLFKSNIWTNTWKPLLSRCKTRIVAYVGRVVYSCFKHQN
jgi:hypothetical protein